ncbi:MAG: TlpA disulfide reductase family protein [Candidatus Omnitrophota bacterium]
MRFFKRLRLILPIIFVFLFLSMASAEVKKDIIIKDLKGRPVNVTGQKGRPAILMFWTTWCRFCRDAIKAMNKDYAGIEKEGITVLVINVGEHEYRVKRYFQDTVMNFRVLLDENSLVADNYDIEGVPTYVLLNKEGKVVYKTNRMPANYKNLLLKK